MSSVNSKLSIRGFLFSSVFLGEKCVLWFFDTVVERDGFIWNKFFLGRLLCHHAVMDGFLSPKIQIGLGELHGSPVKLLVPGTVHET